MASVAGEQPTQARGRSRRTQNERSTETRRKLLDATIDCLVEYGYSGTTTTRVATRAGVTRGAHAHHFHTKNDLVTAAVRHLASRRTEQAFEQIGRVGESDDPLGSMLDLIWQIHNGPVFTATVELWLAARTDPDLRTQMAVVEPSVTSSMIGFVQAIHLDRQLRHDLLNFVYTAMDTVRGLLVGGFAFGEDGQLDARWQRAKAQLRSLAESTLAAHGTTVPELINMISGQGVRASG